jgi:hypothetical protein
MKFAADEAGIEQAVTSLRGAGAQVDAIQTDLGTTEGVDKLYAATKGRSVDACSPTPDAAWAMHFSTRISTRPGASSTLA